MRVPVSLGNEQKGGGTEQSREGVCVEEELEEKLRGLQEDQQCVQERDQSFPGEKTVVLSLCLSVHVCTSPTPATGHCIPATLTPLLLLILRVCSWGSLTPAGRSKCRGGGRGRVACVVNMLDGVVDDEWVEQGEQQIDAPEHSHTAQGGCRPHPPHRHRRRGRGRG